MNIKMQISELVKKKKKLSNNYAHRVLIIICTKYFHSQLMLPVSNIGTSNQWQKLVIMETRCSRKDMVVTKTEGIRNEVTREKNDYSLELQTDSK